MFESNDIVVGGQYQMEEKYYSVSIVTIIEEQHGKDEQKGRTEYWIGWNVRIDKPLGGMSPLRKGTEIEVGYDSRYPHYCPIKLKPIGSPTDYAMPMIDSEEEMEFD